MVAMDGSNVGINIQDQKDNAPEFDQTEYEMRESSEYFSIDSSSGEIISKKRLLHLKTTKSRQPSQESLENVYMLSVIVSDHGKPPLTDECLVKILLTEENKAAPQFSSPDYTKAIPESARPGMELVRVTARDTVDSGLNALIEYSLEAGQYSEYFTIDQDSGEIRQQSSAH